MNADKVTNALTIYVGNKSSAKTYLTSFQNKLHQVLTQSYLENKKVILSCFIVHLMFLFFGSCVSSYNNFTYCYINSLILGKNSQVLLMIIMIFSLASSFSSLGRFVLPLIFCFLSSYIGILQHIKNFFLIDLSNTSLYLFLLFTMFSFLYIILIIKCFIYAKNSIKGKSNINKIKSILSHFLFSAIDICLIYMIYRNIIILW